MERIRDPLVLREHLRKLCKQSSTKVTPAQARMMLAAQGIRATQEALEEALRAGPKRQVKRRVQLKPLDDLPLTPQERAIMERLRQARR